MGRDYKQKADQFRRENREIYQQLRTEIKGQKINPALINLVEYVVLKQSSSPSGILFTVEDVLSNQENREDIDRVLKELKKGIREDVELNDCWNAVYKSYGRIGNYLLFECLVCIVGIVMLALTFMFSESLFQLFCVLWIILFAMGGLGLYRIYRETRKAKKANDFFEQEDQHYILGGR